jgi:hypothetical protein
MRSVSMAITAGLVMGGDPDFSARPDQFMNPSQTAHFCELLMQMRADAVHGMASSPSLDGNDCEGDQADQASAGERRELALERIPGPDQNGAYPA